MRAATVVQVLQDLFCFIACFIILVIAPWSRQHALRDTAHHQLLTSTVAGTRDLLWGLSTTWNSSSTCRINRDSVETGARSTLNATRTPRTTVTPRRPRRPIAAHCNTITLQVKCCSGNTGNRHCTHASSNYTNVLVDFRLPIKMIIFASSISLFAFLSQCFVGTWIVMWPRTKNIRFRLEKLQDFFC